ncbi:YciK family oxidoreductase [Acerihabitans arboris]|uniref:YciK family oxidoreductase n=1 Tax=Acerihabitans arboris TaxID=2691583 RepID=A0A845SGH3_9GAMM|nr:YciK family oxidoreductase [Acerihabitans arboris]NDL62417.1 YciK family oxidoreductase [Acerihabitans arboris]
MYYQPKHDLLAGRIIMVTGAGDGIGREAALTYARHGATLVLLGRTESKLAAVAGLIAAEGGRPARVIPFDLSAAPAGDYRLLGQRLAAEQPRLDGLLNNAGLLGEIVPMAQQSPDSWREVMAVNVNATFMLTQAMLPLLLQASRPSLVFSSSSVGRQGRANWGVYAVSKFATEGMMQVLADEYPAATLRVNCINPGGTRTAMRASAFPREDAARLKTPAEIMSIYLYLMGDDSRRKTGISFDAQPDRKPGPA